MHVKCFGVTGNVVVDADDGPAAACLGTNDEVLSSWNDDDGRWL